jgi:tetratricopeptide (TPR) repeat protein
MYIKYLSLYFHYLEQTVHIAILKLFSPVVLMSQRRHPGDTAAYVKLVLFCRTAYGNLGNVLSAKGQYDEAETSYRKALQYRPNMADVHYNL